MRLMRSGGLALCLLLLLVSKSTAQDKDHLAGDLERCQAALSNCQFQANNADVKRDREQLIADNARLREQNNEIQAQTNRITVILNNSLYNTTAAVGAKQVVDSIKAHPPRPISYMQQGTTHVVINLVIGTIRAVYHPPLKVGEPEPLTVEFEPRSLGVFKDADYVHWHLSFQYAPGHNIEVVYDKADNGSKDVDRELRLGANLTETWRWKVTALSGFEGDSSPLICYLSFTVDPKIQDPNLAAAIKGDSGKPDEIWHENVTWTRAPGILARLWTEVDPIKLISSLAAILGFLTAWYQWRQAANLRAAQKPTP